MRYGEKNVMAVIMSFFFPQIMLHYISCETFDIILSVFIPFGVECRK